MRLLLKIGVILLGLLPAGLVSADTVVKFFGDSAYPPYAYSEGDEMAGYYTEIIREADRRLPGYHIDLRPVPWGRGLKLLETGEIGFLYPPYDRSETRPFMHYSTSIMKEHLALFCRSGLIASGNPQFPDDFKGRSIGRLQSFATGQQFDDAAAEGLVTLREYASDSLIFKQLMAGRLDCYVNDRAAIQQSITDLENAGLYEGDRIEETLSISHEEGYIGLTNRKELYPFMDEFISRFNQVIEDMKTDGTITRIIQPLKNDTAKEQP
ncbi:substrate-binding periplasmic protein [Allohahella marinimesophila]|uniref:ABC transporter substrate-binding protein n=1 Tax=Allohahella marinimesophila TaxID=1054972 RepID=A0ABP7NHW4_9GAMM